MKTTMIRLTTAALFALAIVTSGCSSDEKQQTQPTASDSPTQAKTPAKPSPMERKPAEAPAKEAEAKPAAAADKPAGTEAEPVAAADAMTRAFKVTGMHCSGCENMICTKLRAMEGVKSAQASHKKERVVVLLDGSKEVTDAALMETIQKAGGDYKAEPLPKE